MPKQAGIAIHSMLDNDATHRSPAVKRWLLRRPGYHLHPTPTIGSWPSLVERFFGEITGKRIRRGSFWSVPDRERTTRDYLEDHDRDPRSSVWAAGCGPDPRPHQAGSRTDF